MTASTDVKLVELGEVFRMSPCLVLANGKPVEAFMHYAAPGERAYVSAEAYDAVLARLWMAVEALHDISCNTDNDRRAVANDALAAIGPLPDQP